MSTLTVYQSKHIFPLFREKSDVIRKKKKKKEVNFVHIVIKTWSFKENEHY